MPAPSQSSRYSVPMADGPISRALRQAGIAVRDEVGEAETAQLLPSLIAAGPVGVLVTDLDHLSLAANAEFGDIFGVDPQEAVRLNPEALRQRVYPRLRQADEWRQQLEEVYADPAAVFEDDLELAHPNQRFISRRAGPVFDSEGRIIARIWSFHDVTSNRKRELRRQILHEVSTFIDADPGKVCRLIVEKVAQHYDSTAVLSIRDGKRMLFREVANGDWLGDIRSNELSDSYCQAAVEDRQPLVLQNALDHPKLCALTPARYGVTRCLSVPLTDERAKIIGTLCFLDNRSAEPIDDEDAAFMCILAQRISTELTREKLTFERLNEQKRMLETQRADLAVTRSVLDAMNEAFNLVSQKHELDYVLDRQARVLRGLLGFDGVGIFVPENDQLVGTIFGPKMRQPSPARIDLGRDPALRDRLRSSRGSVRPEIQAETNPSSGLSDLMGGQFLVVATLPFIGDYPAVLAFSRNRPMEMGEHGETHLEALVEQVALLIQVQELQSRLVAANDEIAATHHQLIQSEKLSVAGTLAAGIAHDIRNILSSISLECSLGDNDPAQSLKNVRVQVDRFAVLAHRLLSYAKPKLIAREPTNFNDVLERVLTLVGPQIRINRISVQLDFEPRLPEVMADSGQVEHLFVNLILNAVQAMADRGGSLVLSTRSDRDEVTVEIADSGPGIPAERIDALFEPFFSTRTEGFGLGLYGSRRIAHEHGWNLSLSSAAGEGTTFRVTARRGVPSAESIAASS